MKTNQNNNYWGVIAILLLGLLVLVILLQLATLHRLNPVQTPPSQVNTTTAPAKEPSISITATGSAKSAPSQATINLEVQGRGQTALLATANLTAGLADANAILQKYVNQNSSMITTGYYSLYNQSGYYYTGYNGYVAQESLSATLPSVSNVSAALAELSSVNGISVSGVSADLSSQQLSSLRTAALKDALANATSQAMALFPSKNLTVRNVTVGYYSGPIVYPLGVATGSVPKPATAPAPAFFAGTETVSESITVVFSYS